MGRACKRQPPGRGRGRKIRGGMRTCGKKDRAAPESQRNDPLKSRKPRVRPVALHPRRAVRGGEPGSLERLGDRDLTSAHLTAATGHRPFGARADKGSDMAHRLRALAQEVRWRAAVLQAPAPGGPVRGSLVSDQRTTPHACFHLHAWRALSLLWRRVAVRPKAGRTAIPREQVGRATSVRRRIPLRRIPARRVDHVVAPRFARPRSLSEILSWDSVVACLFCHSHKNFLK
jgi:hypothetical protein